MCGHHHAMRAWCRAIALLLLAAIGSSANIPSEYELKAAYVFNILRFSERRTGPLRSGFLTVGVFGASPVEQALRDLQTTAVRGRKLRVVTLNDEPDLVECEVVFFGRMNGRAPRILAKAKSLGILTIGNEPEFVSMGGLMSLLVESRRIVVEVDEASATAAGWSISSHLLEFARIVKGTTR